MFSSKPVQAHAHDHPLRFFSNPMNVPARPTTPTSTCATRAQATNHLCIPSLCIPPTRSITSSRFSAFYDVHGVTSPRVGRNVVRSGRVEAPRVVEVRACRTQAAPNKNGYKQEGGRGETAQKSSSNKSSWKTWRRRFDPVSRKPARGRLKPWAGVSTPI